LGIPANPLELLAEFARFGKVDLQLSDRSIEDYAGNVRCFAKWFQKDLRLATRNDLRTYIIENYANASPNTRANLIRSFRAFYKRFLGSPITDSFRYPAIPFNPKQVPTKEQLGAFYQALPNPTYKLLFVLYCSTGLREMEILTLAFGDLDLRNRAIVPKNHEGSTKHSWCSFYSSECDDLLSEHLATKTEWQEKERVFSMGGQALRKVFSIASKQSGHRIRPKDLRDWFAHEMGALSVPDRYVDAFQGRIPKSILARHYSDFTLDKMRAVYEKASLRVLS
jgi:integrase